MALPFIVGGAMVGGLINALSGSSERRRRRKSISDAQELLRKNYISSQDIALQGNRINRYFNAAATNVLNSTALSTRGVVNAPVVAAAAAAPLAGQSALAQANYKESADRTNKSITEKIAMMELSKSEESGTDFGDFFGGAVQGGIAGAQIGSMASSIKKVANENFDGIGNKNYYTMDLPNMSNALTNINTKPEGSDHTTSELIAASGNGDFMPQLPNIGVPSPTVASKTRTSDFSEPMKDNFRGTGATGSWIEQAPSMFNENLVTDMVKEGKSKIKYNMNKIQPTSYGVYGRMEPQDIPNPLSSFFDWLSEPRSTENNASNKYLQFRGY